MRVARILPRPCVDRRVVAPIVRCVVCAVVSAVERCGPVLRISAGVAPSDARAAPQARDTFRDRRDVRSALALDSRTLDCERGADKRGLLRFPRFPI